MQTNTPYTVEEETLYAGILAASGSSLLQERTGCEYLIPHRSMWNGKPKSSKPRPRKSSYFSYKKYANRSTGGEIDIGHSQQHDGGSSKK
jgi:hypothetical protein